MLLRFPTLSLLATLILLSPALQQTAIAQTTPTPNPSQRTQPTANRATQAEADRLLQQGIRQYQTSQFQLALESFQQALRFYQEVGNRLGEGTTLNSIGLAYHDLGQYSQTLEYYQQALTIAREVGERSGEGTILSNIGRTYQALGHYSQALEYHEQALTIAEEVGDRIGDGTVLTNIGAVYQALGQYSQALEYYEQALTIAKEVGDRLNEEILLSNIGAVYHDQGQYSQALEYYEQALTIAKEVGDRLGEGITLSNIGGIYHNVGQYSKAFEYYGQALTIAREVGNRLGEGTTLSLIGRAHSELGQYPQALNYYQQGLAITREVGDRLGEGTTLSNIGGVYNYMGQYLQALEYYQQGLTIVRELGNRLGEGKVVNNIGGVYHALGQYSQALEYYQQGLAIRREVGDRSGEGTTLNNIGLTYHELGQLSRALEYYQQGLTIVKELGNRAGEGTMLSNIGLTYHALGQYSQALEQFQQALTIVSEVGDRAGEGRILANIGGIQLLSGQFAAAAETLFRAVEVQESLRAPQLSDASKIALIDTQTSTYSFLQQALIAQNDVEMALEVAERGRARAFVELLAQQSSPNTPNSSIAVTAPTLAQIQKTAREQNATLVEYSIAYAPVEGEGPEQWQASNLYIWVVKPTGEVTFRQVNLAALDVPLNTLISLVRQAIGVRGRGSTLPLPPQIGAQPQQSQQRLQQLYQVLIEPIADLLPSNPNEHVVFIPQGDLFSVPFPALQDANGTYLIESHTIMTAPSIQVLSLTQRSQPTQAIEPSQALIVGNPTMPPLPSLPLNSLQPLSALPGSEQEAIAIAQQFDTQPLLGDAATETAVVHRMASAQIIHLATHGLLDYGDPQALGVRDFPGAIVLARSTHDDGLLTSSEILTMQLNADLVVLSACDTGLGRMSADGAVGLSRSLLSAGAASVIVSLWKVPDDATDALMREFYYQLEQQPNKAQALRQAMLQTMQAYPAPVDWAAFTLIGEAE